MIGNIVVIAWLIWVMIVLVFAGVMARDWKRTTQHAATVALGGAFVVLLAGIAVLLVLL